MKQRLHPLSLLLVLATGVCPGVSLHAKADADTQRAEIREMRDTVLQELYKHRPEVEAKIKKAEGYAVFSNVGVTWCSPVLPEAKAWS